MKTRAGGLLAVTLTSVVALAAPSAQAAPADVTVRIEGASATRLAETPVSTFAGSFRKQTDCSGTSAGGALEVATAGDWGGTAFDFGQSVDTILGEAHTFDSGRYWALYVNDVQAQVGACDRELGPADEVLFYAACAGATDGCYGGEPIDFDAPRRAQLGAAVPVTVSETATTCDQDFTCTSEQRPSQGARITGEGVDVTTDADGRAQVVLARRGDVVLTGRKGNRPPETQSVCVTDGADGFCGTARPGEPQPSPGSGPVVTAAPAADLTAPLSRFGNVVNGQAYRSTRARRLLRGTVSDPSGVRRVEIRLMRNAAGKGRCARFAGARERFVRSRCGIRRARFFTVSDDGTWEYLLPARLGRAKYTLEVRAIDGAGNRDDTRRFGEDRAIFFVR